MKYYIIRINETCSNEGCSFGMDRLNLTSWKAIKKELIETANRAGTEHELELVEVIDNNHASNGHFMGMGITEKTLTKIKFGASVFEKQLQGIFA